MEIYFCQRHQYVNNSSAFCYNCRYFTLIRQRHNITSFIKRAYKENFGLTLCDQDKRETLMLCVITAKKNCVTGRKGNIRA